MSRPELDGPNAGFAQAILDGVASAAARWSAHARQAGVGRKTARVVGNAIEECLARL